MNVLASLLKKCAYILAGLIILFAVLVSLTRSLTPILEQHRADFEVLASDMLHMPVKIQRVEASWYQYQPGISLIETTVLSDKTHEPVLQVQKVRILISIPRSIWQWQLVPSGIMISGSSVNLKQSANGQLTLQGFPLLKKEPYQRETTVNTMIAWVASQPHLLVRNIDLHYTAANAQKRFVTIYQLSVENSDQLHTVIAKASLHQNIPTEVHAALQWQGNETDPAKMHANLYCYLSGLSLTQWLKDNTWQGWQVNQGIGSAKIWATWHQGAFVRAQTTFQLYGLHLYSARNKTHYQWNRFNGQLAWRRQGDEQVFIGNDLVIDWPDHLWPINNFYVALNTENGTLTPKVVHLSYLDLKDVQTLLAALPITLPQGVQPLLDQLKVKGQLHDVTATLGDDWRDWQHLSLRGAFTDLSFEAWHQLPGMRHVSGQLNWDGHDGQLDWQSHDAILNYASLFTRPLAITQLSGVMKAHFADQVWTLQSDGLRIQNPEINTSVQGSVTVPAQGVPTADLNMTVQMPHLQALSHYLPTRVLDTSLQTWLSQAFVDGTLSAGKVRLHGPLNHTLFDEGSQGFNATAQLNNVDLRFAPDWPDLKHMNAELVFAGHQMTLNTTHATLLNVTFDNIAASIPAIGTETPEVLLIHTKDVQSDFVSAHQFIQQTPLRETLGKTLAGLDLQGPMTMSLGMRIPLKTSENLQVSGDINIHDTALKIVGWDLHMDHLRGLVQFTDDTVTAPLLLGKLFDQALTLNLRTLTQAKHNVIQARLASHVSMTHLEQLLHVPLTPTLTGETALTGVVNMSEHAPVTVALDSDLVGVDVHVPAPYAKPAAIARPFHAQIAVQANQSLDVKLDYANLASAVLALAPQKDALHLVRGDVRLNAGKAQTPKTPGVTVTAHVDHLSVADVLTYMNTTSMHAGVSPIFNHLDVLLKHLDVYGQHFANVHVNATPALHDWQLHVSSTDVAGDFRIPVDLHGNTPFAAKLQTLHLQPMSTPQGGDLLSNAVTLPPLDISVDHLHYGDQLDGEFLLQTSPHKHGVTVHALHLLTDLVHLHASGEWTAQNHHATTHLEGVIKTDHLSELLSQFNIDTHDFIATTGRLNFNVSWPDTPLALTLANVNGDLSLKLGSGRMVDIGEASGAKMDVARMLNIFSLQSMPRRFTLDFSDISQKGYSFDSVNAHLKLADGNLYTNDASVNGTLARLNLSGRVGLKDKDYDLMLTIFPHVSTGIPVAAAAAMIWNPLVGVAALAVNAMTSPIISKATSFSYNIKGPWANPSWESMSGVKKG